MMAVDAVIVIIILGAIVLVGMSLVAHAQKKPEINADHERRALATAVRLLDEILAVDTAVPQLPTPLKNKAQAYVNSYYKELES